ncbi:hypothetical protein ACFSFZ_10785 [Mixta tenebrionis]|uniref:hypothetical protein n=1 Tax=Mixta tenebrionis TaxID=2562439 RepID=UPI0013677666|nr:MULTISPECIES: hypothetical protein [Mixta]QHM75154.1 hypothetical protein C7M52_01103 [Mixta theicola]
MADEQGKIPEEIHAAIGYAVSLLLDSGKPVYMHDIAALLQQHAERAASEAHRQHLLRAVRLIAGKMN